MIKIVSFYPFSSLLRITQEFHEDKAAVKLKSLTAEREFEFDYKDVVEISDSYQASISQMSFSYCLLLLISLALSFFCRIIYASPVLLHITQIVYIAGILLLIASFFKSWYFILLDKDGNTLVSIKQTNRNRGLILEALQIVKTKSKNIQEITTAKPFPETVPAFEYTYFDNSDLEKTTDRFYENEILGFTKSWLSERAYKVKYNELSGKIYKGKIGSSIWWLIFLTMGITFFVMNGFFLSFRIYSGEITLYTLYFFGIIIIISWLIQFIKRETIGFYDKKGNIDYWAFVNRANTEKAEEIIKYVQSKIPAENKV